MPCPSSPAYDWAYNPAAVSDRGEAEMKREVDPWVARVVQPFPS